jgi:hypothetical protein
MIRTNGFSIIDNFPFVVMFFAILQRFDKVSWGYYQDFIFLPLSVAEPLGPERESEEQGDLHKEDGFDEGDWDNDDGDFDEEGDLDEGDSDEKSEAKKPWPKYGVKLNGHYGKPINFMFDCLPSTTLHLQNRGSMVQEVERDASNPFDSTRVLLEEEMVIEVSRIDCNDTTEVDHLKKAERSAETRGDITGMVRSLPGNAIRSNIPVLIAGAVWEEPFTATLQRYRIGRPLTRRIVAMVFPKMNRMTELGGSNFAGAFLDCFNCE